MHFSLQLPFSRVPALKCVCYCRGNVPQDGAVEEQSRCSGEIEARKDMHASLGFALWKRKSCFLSFLFFGGISIELSFVFPFSVWGLPWCRFFCVLVGVGCYKHRRVDILLSFGTSMLSIATS